MRDAAVVGGVLGAGCAVVFALAALASMLFPNGTLVSPGFWGGGKIMVDQAMPAVEPAILDVPADGAEGAEK